MKNTRSPSRSPRFFSEKEVAKHCTKDSCWVLLGTRVYDVTGFLRMHPGGEALILRRSGNDISRELDGPPHRHSENARRWMEQYYIGEIDRDSTDEDTETLRQRKKTTEDVTEEEESSDINKCAKVDEGMDLVDWRKPLAWQVGNLGEKYDTWVHQPVDRPIRLFESDFFEANTKTSWYMVPIVWLPLVVYLSWYCYTLLAQERTRVHITSDYSILIHKYTFPFFFMFGMFLWSFVEYCIHRFVFHLRPPAHNYYLITLHFLLHGQHHKSPFDGSRLVFPPSLAAIVIGGFYVVLTKIFPEGLGTSVFVGGLCGYVVYDMIHYYLHYGSPQKGSYLYGLKAYHVKHHFEHQRAGFGISTTFWDHPFNTVIPKQTF
ncbi:fatty acid 2-hydroxylase [Triplophysa rosa]|uniref:Fatty acid 2-hydroxylase n=1 Tax=Triplophysa rosa TaxID=992332 RepID=A0A9W7X0D2_TRIRA|nr:fatty acid 2-hydroxylase [Triplophysa rosa]KAI7812132.1 putative fatty acid 2-hydroxylase [Triplophysa rosa]